METISKWLVADRLIDVFLGQVKAEGHIVLWSQAHSNELPIGTLAFASTG